VIDGDITLDDLGQVIFDRFLAVASGEKTCSEALGVGEEEFAPWPIGVVG
jgi:altronate hydrolase